MKGIFSYYVNIKFKNLDWHLVATTKPTIKKLEDFIAKYQIEMLQALPNSSVERKLLLHINIDDCVYLLEEITDCHSTQLLTDVKLENGTITVTECDII